LPNPLEDVPRLHFLRRSFFLLFGFLRENPPLFEIRFFFRATLNTMPRISPKSLGLFLFSFPFSPPSTGDEPPPQVGIGLTLPFSLFSVFAVIRPRCLSALFFPTQSPTPSPNCTFLVSIRIAPPPPFPRRSAFLGLRLFFFLAGSLTTFSWTDFWPPFSACPPPCDHLAHPQWTGLKPRCPLVHVFFL